jgi:hypothetical protein
MPGGGVALPNRWRALLADRSALAKSAGLREERCSADRLGLLHGRVVGGLYRTSSPRGRAGELSGEERTFGSRMVYLRYRRV